MRTRPFSLLIASALLLGCAGFTPLYPPRPAAAPSEPIADPTPSRVVMHATVTSTALRAALEDAIPKTGEGTFPFVGGPRKFTWVRDPANVRFSQGRIAIDVHVNANADMPISSIDLPLDLKIKTEPVITSEYVVKMQSTEVEVTSNDRLVKLADSAADLLQKVKKEIEGKLVDFSYDLRPSIKEAYGHVSKPIPIPLGDANACALLKVVGVEAGPTVLADGFEKDLAMIVAPSVTIPCATAPDAPEVPLPPLANVATLQPGPFTVTVPIAANYDELAKAMTLAFTDGKLFFSKEFPQLYLEKPEIYAAKDQLVLKLHLAGPIDKYGINTTLDGDIFMTGHPEVVDNELRIPDLEPTIESGQFLLKLKAAIDGNSMRDQARAALHLDIGQKIKAVHDKLSTELAFGDGKGCMRADTHKVEVNGLHVHPTYLRVYVNATASASVHLPCPTK